MAKLTGIALLKQREQEAAAKAAAPRIQQTGTSTTSKGRKFKLPPTTAPKTTTSTPSPTGQVTTDMAQPDQAISAVKEAGEAGAFTLDDEATKVNTEIVEESEPMTAEELAAQDLIAQKGVVKENWKMLLKLVKNLD